MGNTIHSLLSFTNFYIFSFPWVDITILLQGWRIRKVRRIVKQRELCKLMICLLLLLLILHVCMILIEKRRAIFVGYDEEAKTMKGVKISNNRNTKWEKNWTFFKIFLYLGFSSWHLLSINEKVKGKINWIQTFVSKTDFKDQDIETIWGGFLFFGIAFLSSKKIKLYLNSTWHFTSNLFLKTKQDKNTLY